MGSEGVLADFIGRSMRDREYELRRIYLPRNRVNKAASYVQAFRRVACVDGSSLYPISADAFSTAAAVEAPTAD